LPHAIRCEARPQAQIYADHAITDRIANSNARTMLLFQKVAQTKRQLRKLEMEAKKAANLGNPNIIRITKTTRSNKQQIANFTSICLTC